MTQSAFHYYEQTAPFAVAAGQVAGNIGSILGNSQEVVDATGATITIPAAGYGLRLPIIAKHNSVNGILTGDGNPFFSDYDGFFILTPSVHARIIATLVFIHHIDEVANGAPPIYSYRQQGENGLQGNELQIGLGDFSARSTVPSNPAPATTGIIPYSAELIIHAVTLGQNSVPLAIDYTNAKFAGARATYYQFRPVAQVAAANIAADAFSQANNPNTFATIINNIDTALTNLAARTQEYVVIAGDEYRIQDIGRLQRLRTYYNSMLTQALSRAGTRKYSSLGVRG